MQRSKLLTVIIGGVLFCSTFISCDAENEFDHSNNIQKNIEKLKSEPNNCLYLEQIASSYSALESYDKAIEYYYKTIFNCPDNYHALFQIGACLCLTGKKELSIEYMDKAISKAKEKGDNEFVKIYTEEKGAWLKAGMK